MNVYCETQILVRSATCFSFNVS